MSRTAEHRYLIIGGVPKAGTSSLFRWLSGHPQICAARVKETRFFLDADYPVPAAVRYDGSNLDEYERFFEEAPAGADRIRVEASPDYLYSECAKKIPALLPQARMIFILREPVERMVSWYRYARQRGLIPETMTFDDYVDVQVRSDADDSTPIQFRALDQCRYDHYLAGFREAFGDRILELDFGELRDTPGRVMAQVCRFSDICGEYFREFSFQPDNVTTGVPESGIRKMYKITRRRIEHLVYDKPRTMSVLRRLNSLLKVLHSGARVSEFRVQASADAVRRIREFLQSHGENNAQDSRSSETKN